MKKSQIIKRKFIVTICFLLILAVIAFSVFLRTRPLLFTYAKSRAKVIMLNAANTAVINVIERYNISYDKISRISKNSNNEITAIEVDIAQINILKSAISNEIAKIISKNNKYRLQIPMGTLIGNDYLIGLGPKFNFNMTMAETTVVDFASELTDAGINHALHRIIIKIELDASILMIGCTEGFSVSTTAIAAQTVIVGKIPDSFTNVEEQPGDDIADQLFNFADLD